MSLVVISIDRSKLPEHTQEQFEEWVKYVCGHSGSMELKNPLSDFDLESQVKEIGR